MCLGEQGAALADASAPTAPRSYFLNPDGYAAHTEYFFQPIPRESQASDTAVEADRPVTIQTVKATPEGAFVFSAGTAALQGKTFWLKRNRLPDRITSAGGVIECLDMWKVPRKP